jgi:hypothetical protein
VLKIYIQKRKTQGKGSRKPRQSENNEKIYETGIQIEAFTKLGPRELDTSSYEVQE